MNKGLIIEPLKAVYWPIQKAAHTSLLTMFADIIGIKYEGWIHHNHHLFTWSDCVIPQYFNFAYVRNPFDRIMSLYNDKIAATLDTNVFAAPFYAGMPFVEFVEAIAGTPVKNEHYELQTRLIPEGVAAFKIENPDALLSMAGIHNASHGHDQYSLYTEKLVEEIYAEDFKTFNYETRRNNR